MRTDQESAIKTLSLAPSLYSSPLDLSLEAEVHDLFLLECVKTFLIIYNYLWMDGSCGLYESRFICFRSYHVRYSFSQKIFKYVIVDLFSAGSISFSFLIHTTLMGLLLQRLNVLNSLRILTLESLILLSLVRSCCTLLFFDHSSIIGLLVTQGNLSIAQRCQFAFQRCCRIPSCVKDVHST